MAGLANIGGSGINPMALLGLAQGLLAPQPYGTGFGANLSSGIGGALQGQQQAQQMMAQQMQLKRMAEELKKQERADAAVTRLTDPSQEAYQPVPGNEGQAPYFESATTSIDPKFSPMTDLIATNPQAFVSARIKQMTDPDANLPDAIKEMKYYAQHPDLMAVKVAMDPTGPMAQLQAAGLEPGSPEALNFFMNKGRTNINVSSGENLQERGLAELNKNTIADAQGRFGASMDALPQLARMRQNLAAGLKTGQLAPVRGAVANFFTDLGVDKKTFEDFYNLTEGADFDAASKQLTIAAIKAFGANPSNAEREFAAMTVPQIKNNPQAALRLIDRIYSKNSDAVREYGDLMGKLPQDSPNASMLRSAYQTRMETYRKYLGRLQLPPGLPPGTQFAYEDFDGNPVYQLPDGSYKRAKPGGQ